MKHFHISKQDRRWLAAWIVSNLACVCGIVCLIVLLQSESNPSLIAVTQATGRQAAQTTPTPSASGISGISGISVDPSGWRRTNQGWEHISQWQLPRSRPLAEIVLHQRQREPIWVQSLMEQLRGIPPITFAMFQLTAIAAIVWIAETQEKRRTQKIPIASR